MKIPNVFRTHKKLSIAIGIAVILLIVVGIVALSGGKESAIETPPQIYYSKLTGEEVSQDVAEAQILAVMIENSEAARPQSGLDNAGIVFETTTEAGITRYMALYDTDYPSDIAPVRSVRPAFVDWLMGFDAAIAHVGGSAEALEMLEQRNAKDLDQFKYPDPYFRGEDREPPHNMHVKVDNLLSLMKDSGYSSSTVESFDRKDGTVHEAPDATDIKVDFSTPEFSTGYKYDAETNSYTRYLAGQPHVDELTGKPITIKNLIVLKMPATIKAIGSGEALLFTDGTVKSIRWQQENYDSRITLTDESGAAVQLNRGDSWFAAVPATGNTEYK